KKMPPIPVTRFMCVFSGRLRASVTRSEVRSWKRATRARVPPLYLNHRVRRISDLAVDDRCGDQQGIDGVAPRRSHPSSLAAMTHTMATSAIPELSALEAEFTAAGGTDFRYLRTHYARFAATKREYDRGGQTTPGDVLDIGAHWLHQAVLWS